MFTDFVQFAPQNSPQIVSSEVFSGRLAPSSTLVAFTGYVDSEIDAPVSQVIASVWAA
jgi:hypothetical protein